MRARVFFFACAATASLIFAVPSSRMGQKAKTGSPPPRALAQILPQRASRTPAPVTAPSRLRTTSGKGRENPPPVKDQAIDSWDLGGSGLSEEEIAPFLEGEQPESIVFFDRDAIKQIHPKSPVAVPPGAKTLFVADAEFVQKTARERKERSDQYVASRIDGRTEREWGSPPKSTYEIVRFSPGKRDNGETLRPVATDFLTALQGPDYSLAAIDSTRADSMRALLSTVLSLGHGGELVLAVKGGAILDEPGFDFSVFENAFRIAGTNKIFQEFGSIGVSESPEESAYRWYACDPKAAVVLGCVGAVPTNEGGDQFDLAELGVRRARYIWIKDLEINKNFPSQWPTEGVDLDALRLSHVHSY